MPKLRSLKPAQDLVAGSIRSRWILLVGPLCSSKGHEISVQQHPMG